MTFLRTTTPLLANVLFAAALLPALFFAGGGCAPDHESLAENAAKDDGALEGCGAETVSVDDPVRLDSEEASFLALLNEYRSAHQLPPLTACLSLQRASQLHSDEMRDQDFFSHTDGDGGKAWHRACDACYVGACEPSVVVGENLAAGNAGALATLAQWQGSPGHDANMLRADYRVIGIGRATGGGTYGTYWTTVFGGEAEDSCF